MTRLVVAKRDGVIKGPDGTMHRVYKGKTLADARHPAVEHTPQAWMPMEVALPVAGDAPALAFGVDVVNPLAAGFAEARAEAAEYVVTLAEVVEVLAELGYPVPADDDRTPGWLAEAVRAALTGAAPDDVPPPKAARARTRSARAVGDGAA